MPALPRIPLPLVPGLLLGALGACAPLGASVTTPGKPSGPVTGTFRVRLDAQPGVSGIERVNFAVPLPPGLLTDPDRIRVAPRGGAELAAARRALARWPGGSLRSVQVQVNVEVDRWTELEVEVGSPSTASELVLESVERTLLEPDGTTGPRVWVVLPAEWLAPSQVAGPLLPRSAVEGHALDAWLRLCDYSRWGVTAFVAARSDRSVWLFDRPTALYRGYATTGSPEALASAYREAAIYRAGIVGTGMDTRIGVPGAESDLKYHYTQGMALHYLLTGDDRFREAAEDVAVRARALWPDPGYAGGAEFWTERHAGFALLAYEWAAAVTDDEAPPFAAWSDEAVTAYLAMQEVAAHAWEEDARCFAHSAEAHGEAYGYVGCSPWMSAILADGLDAYARRVGPAASPVRAGLARLGRMVARHGRDATGKPLYWMGAGVVASEVDPYHEHWGEAVYLTALAWHASDRSDPSLRAASLELLDGLRENGTVPHMRSFNWQCRSAVMAPALLAE